MSTELIEEGTRLDGPEIDVVAVTATSANDFGSWVDGETFEADAVGGREGAEVAVAKHIPGANGAVEGGGEEDIAATRVG